MRLRLGASGAGGHCAPSAPVRPHRARLKSFVRPECGLTHRPSTSPLDVTGRACQAGGKRDFEAVAWLSQIWRRTT